jgi:hypothetical protein
MMIFIPSDFILQKSSRELKKKFSQYGSIESVRFRSIAVDAPNVPKKFAVAQRKLHPERDNLNGQLASFRFVSFFIVVTEDFLLSSRLHCVQRQGVG